MRKHLLLFFAAFCSVVAVKAETITLEPGENKIEAVIPSLSDGDVIELQDGTYTEWSSLTFNTKVTIKAAEGASPKLALYNWQIKNDFEINGVEIKNVSKDNYLFRITSEVAGTVAFKNCSMQLHDEVTSLQSYIRVEQAVGTLTIDNCVFKEFNATLANQVSHIKLGAAVGTLTINNCIFKDNAKIQETILAAQFYSITNFSMTNCTAYNCGGVNNDLAIFCEHATNVYVDHCTFYNCGKRVIYFTNKDGMKESYLVQNCVVVNSEVPSTNDYCIAIYAGEVKNCAYYKVNAPRGGDATVTSCINADPKFFDPANGNFNFAFTSPLFLAATDETHHIGDPRWGVAESETAIAVPDTLPAMQAVLSGTKISATEDGIKWNDNSANPNDNSASWVIDVNKTGIYKLIINDTTGSGHTYIVSVANAEGWLYTKTQTEDAYTKGNHVFDAITFDEVGQYMVRLKNGKQYSSSVANKIYLDYAGGAVIDVPATLPNDEAVLTGTKISRVDGAIKWGGEYDSTLNYVSWNINVEKAGYYDVLLSTGTTSGREYHIYLYDGDEQKDEVVETRTWSAKENENLGRLYIESAGLYVIRAYNLIHNSSASIVSLTLDYAGGAVIDVPATLPNEEALLTGSKISRTADGIKWGDNEDITEDYATWNISVAEAGDYLVTMAVKTGETSTHTFFINIYNGDAQVGDTIKETTKTPISLAAGTYTVHLGNNKQWSSAVMASVAIKSASGTVVEMPGTLQADDALLGGDDNVKVDGDGYICFSEGENVPNCWATWQTNWVKTGTYDVILDVNATNGHQLVVEVLDGETVIKTFEHGYSTESGKLSIGKFVLSETKSYTIRLTNKQDWSDARIKSIAFIPFITIDNEDTNVDFTEYENQFVSVQLNRTFTGGMYNPICLPFALSSSALSNILKADKSYVLGSASLEEQKLYVELEQGSGIYQGTPNMIKPLEDVENPVFTNVKIKTISPDQTTRDVLRLQGSFASHTIDNSQTALLVGANNTLFFPSDDIPYIKSMRAYFILVGQAVGAPIKAACFREPGNAPTEMIIVGGEVERQKGHRKVLVDGQIRIQHEGKCYSILGLER